MLVISNKKKRKRIATVTAGYVKTSLTAATTLLPAERFVLGITGQADVLFEVSLLNEHKCKRSAEIWVFPSGKCRAITPCCSYLSFSVR